MLCITAENVSANRSSFFSSSSGISNLNWGGGGLSVTIVPRRGLLIKTSSIISVHRKRDLFSSFISSVSFAFPRGFRQSTYRSLRSFEFFLFHKHVSLLENCNSFPFFLLIKTFACFHLFQRTSLEKRKGFHTFAIFSVGKQPNRTWIYFRLECKTCCCLILNGEIFLTSWRWVKHKCVLNPRDT